MDADGSNTGSIAIDDSSDDSQSPETELVGGKKQVRKKRKLTSEVWKHFKILDSKPGEELKCECKKCGAKYRAESKYGTGNLSRHLKKCVKMTTKDIGQFLLSSNKGSILSTRNPQFNQEIFRELLVRAIIRHDLPFSFVEYEGIRDVFKYLEPQVSHISRNTARTDIKKMHASEVDRLRNELINCPSRICLTSDAWSSIVTDGYLSLTAHYIDKNWVLQKKILNFSYMPPPHSGAAFAEKIYNLASSWGIEKKLFSLTLDNASANDVCVQILKNQLKLGNALVYDGTLFHIRCCAHILNLIVQDGLKEIDKSVDKIRECVKYIKGSQVRKQKFAKCVEQASLDSKKALVQDVPTRWNSTYKMLSSALYYRLAFCHLQLSDSNFHSCPSPEEWENVKKISDFLEIFYNATNAFSGSKYPTANLYFPHVFLIQLKLAEECNNPDNFMRKIAQQMFVKFSKYWCEFNLLLAVAVVFDPRYKFQFIEFSYRKLYGPESNELARVKDTLFSLFNEYMTQSEASRASSSCSRGSNEVHSIRVVEKESQHSTDILKEFDQFDIMEASSTQKCQLEMYLDEPKTKRTSNVQVLDFWKAHGYRYPELARLARDILCVPVSTVASESAFSLGGRILDQYRSTLSPQIVEALICSRDWLFGENASIDEVIQQIMGLNINKNCETEVECGEDSNSYFVT